MEAFTEFDTLDKALTEFDLQEIFDKFMVPLPHTTDPSVVRSVDFSRLYYLGPSEFARCEGMIFPVLREAWEPVADKLQLFNRPRVESSELRGNPEYVLSRISRHGRRIFGPPHLLVVEAKQEKWLEGWGQCLDAMVAARELNNAPGQPVFGIVTTGHDWEFGRLDGSVFLHDTQQFVISDLDRLIGAVKFVFAECRKLAEAAPKN